MHADAERVLSNAERELVLASSPELGECMDKSLVGKPVTIAVIESGVYKQSTGSLEPAPDALSGSAPPDVLCSVKGPDGVTYHAIVRGCYETDKDYTHDPESTPRWLLVHEPVVGQSLTVKALDETHERLVLQM
jgi:hypothetical protein